MCVGGELGVANTYGLLLLDEGMNGESAVYTEDCCMVLNKEKIIIIIHTTWCGRYYYCVCMCVFNFVSEKK